MSPSSPTSTMNSRSALPRMRNETAFEARLAPDTLGDVSFGDFGLPVWFGDDVSRGYRPLAPTKLFDDFRRHPVRIIRTRHQAKGPGRVAVKVRQAGLLICQWGLLSKLGHRQP